MTATERLRELLDERGVEWAAPDESWNQDSITYWKVGSIKWVAFESENGTLWLNCNSVTDLTPEQAIAATLGRGECKADETDVIKCWVKCKDKPSTERMELIHVMECSVCGGTYEHVNGGYEFCPRCRAKVVDG